MTFENLKLEDLGTKAGLLRPKSPSKSPQVLTLYQNIYEKFNQEFTDNAKESQTALTAVTPVVNPKNLKHSEHFGKQLATGGTDQMTQYPSDED